MSATLELTADTVQALADSSIALAAWRDQGRTLAQADNARQWEIGDWLVNGEQRLGRKAYPEALAIFRGYRKATLKDFATVARHVPSLVRTNELSWAHHKLVAKFLKPEYQSGLLAQAIKHNLPLSKFRNYINKNHPSNKPAKPRTVSVPFTNAEYQWLHICAAQCGTTDSEMVHRIFADWRKKFAAGEVGDPIYYQPQPFEQCSAA